MFSADLLNGCLVADAVKFKYVGVTVNEVASDGRNRDTSDEHALAAVNGPQNAVPAPARAENSAKRRRAGCQGDSAAVGATPIEANVPAGDKRADTELSGNMVDGADESLKPRNRCRKPVLTSKVLADMRQARETGSCPDLLNTSEEALAAQFGVKSRTPIRAALKVLRSELEDKKKQ